MLLICSNSINLNHKGNAIGKVNIMWLQDVKIDKNHTKYTFIEIKGKFETNENSFKHCALFQKNISYIFVHVKAVIEYCLVQIFCIDFRKNFWTIHLRKHVTKMRKELIQMQ